MNSKKIPKNCTVNSSLQPTSLLLFLPILSSCFWLNQTPLISCAHRQGTCPQSSAALPPWGSSVSQAIARSQRASRIQSQNMRETLLFSGCSDMSWLLKYCSSLLISQFFYLWQRCVNSTAQHQEHVVGNQGQRWRETGLLGFAALCC